MSTTPTAQTAAEHLPLVFHGPPGWPTPTLEWVNTHLGWQPPPGWVPVPGCPHSPPRWTFWSRNEAAWQRMARPYLRRARRSASLGVIALLGGIVVTTAGVLQPVLPPLFSPIEQSPVLRVLAGGLILAALLQLTQARASSRRIQDALLVNVREGAERVRIQSDREHYEQYLRSNGDD